MAPQIDTNQLKKAEAAASLAKELITQAIEKSAANPELSQEALKQAVNEFAQAHSMISQVQSSMQAQQQPKP